jgi:hypothetical protein
MERDPYPSSSAGSHNPATSDPAASNPAASWDDAAPFSDMRTTPASSTDFETLTQRRPIYSGWLLGIIGGIIIGLWALPPVRYTLGAQLSFAFAEDGVPWMTPLDASRRLAEAPVLDRAAATCAGDYLVQVGRATAFVETNGTRGPTARSATSANSDRTLLRLTLVTRDFPDYHGACAHLARYMMKDRVRLVRTELASNTRPIVPGEPGGDAEESGPARSIPATHRDVRLMEWALRRGEQLEPDNAFWPAMLATTYFAAERDRDGLRELHRINHTIRWDAYLYEEILGQWRLYSVAYGDHGAMQKIGPLSLLAFPHLREIRRMAQLARWYAEQAARQGDIRQAIQIRHSIAHLGRTLRETASWAYEALYGTELTLIAYTDGGLGHVESLIQTPAQWRPEAQHYLSILNRAHLRSEITWITQEVEASCALRKAVRLARSDASYPGIPPGIPLAPLFGNWMAGVSLIQQCIALFVAMLLVITWGRYVHVPTKRVRLLFLPVCVIATLCTGGLLFLGVPSEPMAIAFLISTAVLLLLLLEYLYELRHEGRGTRKSQNPKSKIQNREAEVYWRAGTTVRMLALLLVPGLTALIFLRPVLSGMHPVAILLTRWFSSAPTPGADEMLKVALLAGALPLAVMLASGIWGIVRQISPLSAALIGLRRITLPAITCLVMVYLLLLQRTLILDAESSRAINEAARNDRQWVLTHVTDEPG